MGKSNKKDFFKKLREDSERTYHNVPALNWGEMIDDKYVISNRYFHKWKACTGENKGLEPLTKDVREYILDFQKTNNRKVSAFIGTDSQNHLSFTRFVTVIVLYVERNGAHILVSRQDKPKIYDYRYRLLREVDVTAELVRDMREFFETNEIPWEIHSDFNSQTNFRSNGIVTEATNYLKHLGFEHKIKPAAFAASYAADHFC